MEHRGEVRFSSGPLGSPKMTKNPSKPVSTCSDSRRMGTTEFAEEILIHIWVKIEMLT